MDLIAKLGIVEAEADESIYWLGLLVESGLIPEARVDAVRKEANKLLAMTVASTKTLRSRKELSNSATAIQNPKSRI